MRRAIALSIMILGTVAFGSIAEAQAPQQSKGYAEAFAQAAFGNASSQAYGGEVGVNVLEKLQLFVEFGADLSGTETNLMICGGGGVMVSVWRQLLIDLQFRTGRISTEDEKTTVHRVGLGLGIKF